VWVVSACFYVCLFVCVSVCCCACTHAAQSVAFVRHDGITQYVEFCVMHRVGQNHTFICIYGVHTVLLAGKSPYIRSYTVQIYGSGQLITHA